MAIPTPIVRNLEQDGILRTMAIDLSDNPEDRAAVIEVLRSKLYSDKILAPIREYSTNAVDSHVESGIPDVPIKITLPTSIFPEFKIRDFGYGLTPDEVEKVYIKYGRSTKRNTNKQTGQLGLGCKSAFSYGDNFVVVSYKDGVKTTYNLTINGVCTIVSAEPMADEDRTGIEIIIPVNMEDVYEFQTKAIDFFKYWKTCPELNGGDVAKLESLRNELSIKPLFSDESWEIRPNGGYSYGNEHGIATMGNVPYPINWGLISSKINLNSNDKDKVLYDFIRNNKTILRFEIGELDFSASRESLEYTEKTCKAIVEKVRGILDSIFKILDAKIQSAASYWDALVIYNQIFGRDDEKIFQGDVYRLESYYKGKFNWNGITINGGYFDHLDKWDIEKGHITDNSYADNPVMMMYENRNGRIKQHKPTEYSYNKIYANNKIRIVIHDLEKATLTKSAVRYVFFEHTPTENPKKVYFFRFKDDAQKKDFIAKNNFESAPVIYVSDIQDKIKSWLKSNRVYTGPKSGNSSGVRDVQPTRYFQPANQINYSGYYNDVNWKRDSIDLHEEEGYYLNIGKDDIVINNREIYNLSNVSHHCYTLLNCLGEKVEKIYGFSNRTVNAKWFEQASNEGQWTNFEEYVKENKDLILHGKGTMIVKANDYFSQNSNDNFISIEFAKKILPLLKNKNGSMYKVCSEISDDFTKHSEIANALRFFGITDELNVKSPVNFEKLFDTVGKSYPMLTKLQNRNTISTNSKGYTPTNDFVQMIADYVNMADSFVGNE